MPFFITLVVPMSRYLFYQTKNILQKGILFQEGIDLEVAHAHKLTQSKYKHTCISFLLTIIFWKTATSIFYSCHIALGSLWLCDSTSARSSPSSWESCSVTARESRLERERKAGQKITGSHHHCLSLHSREQAWSRFLLPCLWPTVAHYGRFEIRRTSTLRILLGKGPHCNHACAPLFISWTCARERQQGGESRLHTKPVPD